MGKPLIGEVVVLPFPQTDLQAGKRRPPLVVANLTGDDLISARLLLSLDATPTQFHSPRATSKEVS